MNKKILLTTLGLMSSELMPFVPQFRGNGLVHTISDLVVKNHNIIETIVDCDINNDGVIGKSVSEDSAKNIQFALFVSSHFKITLEIN